MNAAATSCWPVPTPAVATVIEPGSGFRRRDNVLQARLRQILAADHHVAKLVDQRDGDKILLGIVGQLRIQRRIERHVGKPADHQRIAVGLAGRRGLGADHGAGAGLVLDHETLAGAFGQHVGDKPPDQVVAAAGPDRDDDLDGPVGIAGLRLRRGDTEHECRGDPCQRAAKSSHPVPPKMRPSSGSFLGSSMRHAASGGNGCRGPAATA